METLYPLRPNGKTPHTPHRLAASRLTPPCAINGANSNAIKAPPHCTPETESGVIGCILIDADFSWPILQKQKVSADWFYDFRYGDLFARLQEMRAQRVPLDEATIANHLAGAGSNIGKIEIANILNTTPSAANLKYYLEPMEACFRHRNGINLVASMGKSLADAPDGHIPDDVSDLLGYVESGFRRSDLPEIVDAATMCAKKPERPPELIYGLLHKGTKLVLGGCSKSFKTWTLLDLALSVSAGEPWLSLKTSKGRVLYLNLELPPWSFQGRIQEVCAGKNLPLKAGMLDLWNLRNEAASYDILIPKIRDAVREHGHSLIIIDPIYKLLGDLDENKAGDMNRLMTTLEDMANATGAAIAFGAHFAKGNASSKESIDRISGSGVFARDPDSILTFTKHETDGAFSVESTLRNFKPVEPFVVQWQFPLFRRNDDLDPTRLKQNKGGRPSAFTEETLLASLGDKTLPPAEWLKDTAKKTGIGRSRFYDIMRGLKESGRVKTNEKGEYFSNPETVQKPS